LQKARKTAFGMTGAKGLRAYGRSAYQDFEALESGDSDSSKPTDRAAGATHFEQAFATICSGLCIFIGMSSSRLE
jgi:hypothetical protein